MLWKIRGKEEMYVVVINFLSHNVSDDNNDEHIIPNDNKIKFKLPSISIFLGLS